MLKDARGENLIVAKRIGFPAENPTLDPVPLGSSLSGQVALKPQPLLVEHVATASRPGYRGRSFMILPLKDSRNFFGVVNITDHRDETPFSRADLERAEWLTNQLGANLGNANHWEELQQLAMVDTLTGLFNRRYFDRQFHMELGRARRYERQVTLALLDVDHFKTVNDRNGYAVGDALIRAVADVIRKCFREVDIVTRWGGDEFAVLLPDTGRKSNLADSKSSSMHFVERVRRAVEREDFSRIVRGLTLNITVSGGVATYPSDANDRQGLFLVANQALQRAKRSGNNRICMGREITPGETQSTK
jgi:diguanylate cyclase (GGDEF)-like protein